MAQRVAKRIKEYFSFNIHSMADEKARYSKGKIANLSPGLYRAYLIEVFEDKSLTIDYDDTPLSKEQADAMLAEDAQT